MITNKDIRVEAGNLVLNGDKYPLDGQSPEAIMQIVEDNSDSTPTENSDAPITSGGVYTALAGKEDILTFDTAPTDESTNPVTSGGIYTALAAKTAIPLTAGSGAAVDVNETYQIPSDMLDRSLLTINVNRYARLGSVSVSIAAIKSGDCASGIKITPGSAANPSLDASVIITISTTGLITISAINNFDPCFIQLVAI